MDDTPTLIRPNSGGSGGGGGGGGGGKSGPSGGDNSGRVTAPSHDGSTSSGSGGSALANEEAQIGNAEELLALTDDPIAYIEGMVLALSGGNRKGPEATADSCDVQGSDATNCLNSPPDYTTAGATLCIPDTVVCGTLSLTHTRYGEMYCGFGGGLGAGDSMSMQQGDLLSAHDTSTEINGFVGGWRVSGSACSGEGIGVCATFVDGQPQRLPWDSNFSSSFVVERKLHIRQL